MPETGGVENVAWQVAHELERAGERVTLITREAPAPAIIDERRPDQPTPRSPGPSIRRLRVPTFWQALRVLAFSRAAADAARSGDYDVVHSFSRTRHQDLYRAGGGSHADYLRRTHSPTGRALRHLSPRHRSLLSIESRVFADPDQRIQCASRLVADRLVDHHGVARDRILLLPNAVDADRFGGASTREAGRRLRAELDAKAATIWLFPASGWRRKGLPVLFQALARRRDPTLHLWIAGRDDAASWRARAARLGILDRIRFLGPRNDLEDVYAAVDGMILPTRYDAFANVTLEAAASRLPVVTTRANGAAEWLGDAVWPLEDEGDPSAVERAFDVFQDPERRAHFGARARKMAEQLDWPSHVSRLRDEYRRILSTRGARSR